MKKSASVSIFLSSISALLTGALFTPAFSSAIYISEQATSGIKQSTGIQQQCSTTLRTAVRRIEEVKNVSVVGVYDQDISTMYVDSPANAPVSVTISMTGSRAPNIMASPQLLTSIATQIITECQPVSLVIIGENRSDNYGVFGLMDGEVVVFRECGSDMGPLNWGEVGCL
ncbi:MAG: hypothetical protein AAF821_03995 [Cyanobacteria bacterium P01_D01_bin.156]